MRWPNEIRGEVQSLRSDGRLSYGEIRQCIEIKYGVDVPKKTMAYWLSGDPLTDDEKLAAHARREKPHRTTTRKAIKASPNGTTHENGEIAQLKVQIRAAQKDSSLAGQQSIVPDMIWS